MTRGVLVLDYLVSPLFKETEIGQRGIRKNIFETFMQWLYQKERSMLHRGAQPSAPLSSFGLCLSWKVNRINWTSAQLS